MTTCATRFGYGGKHEDDQLSDSKRPMTKGRDDRDCEVLVERYLADWLETSCAPETAAEAEKKVRDAAKKHIAQCDEELRSDDGAAAVLAAEVAFAINMESCLTIRRVRQLKHDSDQRIAALEQRLDAIYHEDGREIAAPRMGFADDSGRRRVTVLPICKAHQPGKVYYAGEMATFSGSTYQALCDTGQAPPHADWNCIAAAAGAPMIQGTFDPTRKNYRMHSIVITNNASFIALHDSPGPCPGSGWQLLAGSGKTGKPGERGPAGPTVRQMNLNKDGLLTLINSDGSVVTCDMYPLLSKL